MHPPPPPIPPLQELAEALLDVLTALDTHGRAQLPPVAGLPAEVVVRALYRGWLEIAPWGPLVHLSVRHVPGGQVPPWVLAQSAGGWLFLDGIRPAEQAYGRTKVLWTAPGPARELGLNTVAQILRQDRSFGIATDPALAPLRRALLSHCRSNAPIHISGEPGTGKSALARWAHDTLDDRPLSVLRSGQGVARPGEWVLVDEPAELGAEQRAELARLLDPPATDAWAAPWPRAVARPAHPALAPILGHSAALAEVLCEVVQIATVDLPVLITGEPGTGKESLARAVHDLSGRTGEFVAVDMGALSEDLAESELFGHKKGAFTGADRGRPGAFRQAHGGTLFLDELGNLPPRLQVKLLRVLQERQVQPVGEDRPVPVDVRLVAATNADLAAMVRRGAFRADLLSRLDAVALRLPPLRERIEDLDALAQGLLGRAGTWCTPAAREVLAAHPWPGNIRELGNVLRYARAVCPPGQPIDVDHLGPLAPRTRRRVPVLVCSSLDPHEGAGWGLDRRLVGMLTTTTLAMPPLRERGARSLRARILDGLRGRLVTPDALDALAQQPWWGNLPELQAALAALAAAPDGPIDRAGLSGHLPHLLDAAPEAPIRAVLLPNLDEQGRLTGLEQEWRAGALLIGRIQHVRALAGDDPRAVAWREAIRALAGDTSVACLDLSLIPQLSRAHVLVTRGPEGMVAHALPGAGLRVQAGRLQEAGLQACAPGAPVTLGAAGEIVLLRRAGGVLVQIFLFQGAVALAEQGHLAAARVQTTGSLAPTQDARTQVPPATEAREASGLRVWAVTADERAALVALLAGFEGGQLKAHVLAAAEGWRDQPALRRLGHFLEEAPRLSQYLTRLVEHEENQPLRRDLARALLPLPDADLRLELLPKGLRDAVLSEAQLKDSQV